MSFRIPSDGPDAVLFRVARKFRLRYSQAFVVQAVAAHPRPNTLLAVVEIAARMGLTPKPAQTDDSGLTEVTLPAVVHLKDRNGEEGFGVLEAVSRDRARIWDSGNGRRAVSRGDFLAAWSGVVVMFERADVPGAPERRYARQRFMEVVGGGINSPSLTGGRAAQLLRIVLTVLVIALLAFASFETRGQDRIPGALLVLLALAGVVVTTLMAVSMGDRDNPLADRVCKRGKLVDCHSVLSSRYSRLFALPLSDIGLAFYCALLLLIASTGWSSPVAVWRVVTLCFIATLPLAVLLVALQVSMRQLCTLCMATHVVNVLGALTGWWLLWEPGLGARDLYLGALFAFYFMIVLFIVIPYFRKSASLTLLSERQRKIAGSPFGSLAQLLTGPPTLVEGPSFAVPVAGSVGEHEVVIFVHPGCGKCLPVLRELLGLMGSVQMNAFVGVAPKDPTEADRQASAVLVAAWMAMPSEKVVDGYMAAKKLLGRLSGPDGPGVLADELRIDPEEIERRLEDARSMVERAERAVDEHMDGTPAVFVDSRPYAASLVHLAYLIKNHPDLVRLK